MKQTRNMLIGIAAATAWLLAGNVGTLTTFTANTTAKASEVNGNFSAVKTAVNGNANDIATNAHDITTNTNSINTVKGDYVSSVTAGTGLTGGGNSGDVTLKPADGYISISPAAFGAVDPKDCYWFKGYNVGYFTLSTTSNVCSASTNVSLPDKATIASVKCTVVKNDNNSSLRLYVELDRSTYEDGVNSNIGIASIITHSSNKVHLDLLPLQNTEVDNQHYSYTLSFIPPHNTNGTGSIYSLYTCVIGYSY